MKAVRQSNIELLRIFSICGVIILHYNGYVGNALNFVQSGTANYWLVLTAESLCICAVNIFLLISGYFSCTSQRTNYVKVIQLLVQVIVFQMGIYLLEASARGSISTSMLIQRALPKNYFVILYIAMYLVGPYVNVALKNMTGKQLTKCVVLLLVLFSLLPTAIDLLGEAMGESLSGLNPVSADGDGYGYTALNFILMYILGAYLRLHGLPKLKGWHCTLIAVVCTGLILYMSLASNPGIARSYCNPLVIALAVSILLLFTKFSFHSKVINCLSQASFTVYLFHPYPLAKFRVEQAIANGPVYLAIHMLLACIGIFLMSWVIYMLYALITKPVFKFLSRRIPSKEI